MSHTLETDQLESVCKMGQGAETCAFLTATPDGFECAKGTPVEGHIRGRLAAGSMGAKGDNCSGPPDFAPNS